MLHILGILASKFSTLLRTTNIFLSTYVLHIMNIHKKNKTSYHLKYKLTEEKLIKCIRKSKNFFLIHTIFTTSFIRQNKWTSEIKETIFVISK